MSTEKRLAFICYRDKDSRSIAEILYGQLSARLGPDRLFLATEDIARGKQWLEEFNDALAAAVVMVVLIGPRWLSCENKDGQGCLEQPNDWVVHEIHTALERRIPIIPVLVDGAARPSEEALPAKIRGLSTYQLFRLHSKRGQSQELELGDVERLHNDLEMYLSPIKGLHSYQPSDRAIFKRLQRERELGECRMALTQQEMRIGVLSGRAGCGKTSFIRAGIMPALDGSKTNSPIGIYVKFTREDPFSTLRKAFQDQLQLSLQQCDLHSWFDQAAATKHLPIVLLFDQFEEFLHGKQDVREKFEDGLKVWYQCQSPSSLKILFSIQSGDHLVPLFKKLGCINRYQIDLEPFSRDQAFASLKALAEADGLLFDERFVRETVLDDILDPTSDRILPLQLQIVAWAIQRHSKSNKNNRGFTPEGYKELDGLKGSLDHLLFTGLGSKLEEEQETMWWILNSLIDHDTGEGCRLTVNEVSNTLPMTMSKDDLEQRLKWLTDERLVWSKDEKDEISENVVRRYELAHRFLIIPVKKKIKERFSDIRTANDELDRLVRYYRTNQRYRYLKLKDYWLVRKVMKKGKIRWAAKEPEKTIIKKSRQRAIMMLIGCVFLMAVIGRLGYPLMPDSAETKIQQSVYKALSNSQPNDPPSQLTTETLIRGIAALGKWEEWENKARVEHYPEPKADRGRSELAWLAAHKQLWGKSEDLAISIDNPRLKAITFIRLAEKLKESKEPTDEKLGDKFIDQALSALKDMPDHERPERVHVLYDLQMRIPNHGRVDGVKKAMHEETEKSLLQIEKHIRKVVAPRESLGKNWTLREQVRLLALKAEVASYAGETLTIRNTLKEAKGILGKIQDNHDRSIAFHLLIEGAARCIEAGKNEDSFLEKYLNELVESTPAIDRILGLIEASAIILRAEPPIAVRILARELLHQAEGLASSPQPDHKNQQLSEEEIPSPASFLLREVRTLEIAHAQLLSKPTLEDSSSQKESAIDLVLKMQQEVEEELRQNESVGPERLDLLLTQLAVARAFAKMNELKNVAKALEFAREYAQKLSNTHQKSAVLRAIVEIATGVDTGARADNTSVGSDKYLMNFARKVLDHESLETDDKTWANASYAIGLARQTNNARNNPTGAIERRVDGGSWMSQILWKFFGGCPTRGVFSDSITIVPNQKGPERDFALHGVARELAKAQYFGCALEKLNDVSDVNLRTFGYAEILPGGTEGNSAPSKIGVLTLLDQVSPDQDSLRSQDKMASMRLVPGGHFIMGTAYREIDQSPPHYVYLNAFYIDEHEVTVTQYEKFYSAHHEQRVKPKTDWGDEIAHKYGMKPVIGITYEQATWYCEWAGKRLLTEAEWEKAARGTYFRSGEEDIFPWGSELPDELSNVDAQKTGMLRAQYDIRKNMRRSMRKSMRKNWTGYEDLKNVRAIAWSNAVRKDRGNGKSGQERDLWNPGNSPYQVFDMAGSVWEWVKDWYSPYYYNHSSSEDPQGPPGGTWRVLRGGSWDNTEGQLEATYRLYKDPPYHYSTIGFRCAK